MLMDGQSVESGVTVLPHRVLKSLARTAHVQTGGTVLEVGPLRPDAMQDWAKLGLTSTALTDTAPSVPSPPGQVLIGDVAGGMPVTAHSVDCVILRTAKTFQAGLTSPESLLGAANLLSCLKPNGSLLVLAPPDLNAWKDLLSAFPVKVSEGQYHDGLMYWLTFQFLIGRQIQLPFLRAEIGKDAISRLQWHRLVRELVMKRMQSSQSKAA